MRHLLTVIGIVAALILLLAVAVKPALAGPLAVERADRPQDVSWIFLALVGGLALLAGVVWVRKLRRMMP
jgi:hypothetical protein